MDGMRESKNRDKLNLIQHTRATAVVVMTITVEV
jgi:hypothetical protein